MAIIDFPLSKLDPGQAAPLPSQARRHPGAQPKERGRIRREILGARACLPLAAGVVVGLLASPRPGSGQGVEEALRSLSPENAQAYVEPVAVGFARALSTGLASSLKPRGFFELSLSLRGVAARIPQEDQTYGPHRPSSLTYEGVVHEDPYEDGGEASTASGDGGPVTIPVRRGSTLEAALLAGGGDPDAWALELPAGRGLDVTWIPMLEATLGLGLGTDLVARFSPTVSWDDALGDLSLFGVEVLHSLEGHLGLPDSPFSMRLSGSLHRAKAGGYLETLSTTAGLVTGLSLGPVALFAQGRIEGLRVRTRHVVSNPSENPALPPDGELVEEERSESARSRLGFGALLTTGPVILDLEVAPSRGGALSVGLTFSPRGGRGR